MYTSTSAKDPPASRVVTAVIMLLHHLDLTYPSQQTYFEHLKTLLSGILKRSSPVYTWITAVAHSLRTSDFIRFNELSQPHAFECLFPSTLHAKAMGPFHHLPKTAVCTLMCRLRSKARERAWIVLRGVYREFSASDSTRNWLRRYLALDAVYPETTTIGFEDWMKERELAGHVRPKDGEDGKWIVCKVR
ncbi:hypothetical protein ID866_9598 [Astraeus odoratus]|nr:hypothetical protein ID866_9598 [Astraeus odoratus]